MSGAKPELGVWMVGALGDIATTVVLGAGAISRGLATTRGLVTALPDFEGLDLAPLDRIAFGGHDVRDASPVECARALAREAQLFPEHFVESVRGDLEAHGKRIRPGVAFGCGSVVSGLEGSAARSRRGAGPKAALAALRADLRAFRQDAGVERAVLVHVASTEPEPPALPEFETEEGVRSLVERGDARLPASVLYALAAADEGVPYVNFTPCLGSAARGTIEAFLRLSVPHMGRDGKTGETLLRSALAPMFLSRNLGVLSWAGFNILGNRDGQVLEEPRANAAKNVGKGQVLREILGDSLGSSLTRIDYVPSIGDWKTAWDHVHFEGFLGMRGTLQLTWRAADSSLAAPLVLDLVRLADLAARKGKKGLLPGLSCFFKNPTGVSEHALPKQFEALLAFAAELR